MDSDDTKPFLLLQLSAGLIAIVAAAIAVVLWLKLKVWSMDIWSGISFSFMPLVIGLAAGVAVRFCTHQGSFGLGGFVVAVTLVASLVGTAIQHMVEVEHRLHVFAKAAYDETFEYAQRTAGLADDAALRKAFTNSEVAVIGRLAHMAKMSTHEEYWRVRNLYHLHWIACRQIINYGQGGVDKTIWQATQVREGKFFIDQIVAALAKEPVTDEDLAKFKEWEQPYLQRVAANYINRQEFESQVVAMGIRALTWNLVLFHGMGPFVGIFTGLGALTGFKLVNRESEPETEIV